MPVIGFNFNEVNANKKSPIKGKISIKQDIKLTNVEKEQMSIPSSDDTLKFGFEFRVDYSPNIGEILLKGNVLYMADPKSAKTILDFWKKDKKIKDQNLMVSIFNTIINKSNVKALMISDDLGLPAHIKLPRVTPKN